tara:strand:+ start:272 stop:388 length:117 start_codon:yes stop_codon:yes gene_type:complete
MTKKIKKILWRMRDRKETKDRVKAVLILVGMTITERFD